MFFPVRYQRFKGNYVDLGTANARLYNRKFLVDNNLMNVPGLHRMQDNVFNLWVFDRANKIYYRCKRLYHYTFNQEAATQKYAPDNIETMNFLYECMLQYVRECHDTDEYYQRLYSRFLRIFGEIFKLNYSSPSNPDSLRVRVKKARSAFSKGNFREVIINFDVTSQGKKTKRIHRLFLDEKYLLLVLYYSISIRTRKLRLILRGG